MIVSLNLLNGEDSIEIDMPIVPNVGELLFIEGDGFEREYCVASRQFTIENGKFSHVNLYCVLWGSQQPAKS